MTKRKIQSIVYYLADNKQNELRDKLGNFVSHPANLRKRVVLHLSVVLYCLPVEKVPHLITSLTAITSGFKPLCAQVDKLEKIGPDYIGFSLQSEELQKIHETVVEELRPLVSGIYNPKYLKHNLSEKELFYLKNYGYQRIKEFYAPHLTIGKYESEEVRDIEYLSAPSISGEIVFDKLVLDECIEGSGIPANILWEKKL